MADDKATARGGGLFGWLRAAVTSVLGLVGGACLMYFSPLLDKVIKPGKPVANFQSEVDGLKAVFHNRSTGGSQGWWDFGDGSALQPFQPTQDVVTHTYTRAGSYTVKLSVRNLFGEDNERSVSVALDQAAPSTAPAIEALDVAPLQANAYAPATFRVVSKVKNADLCVLALGDDHPLEFVADNSASQERYVTFAQPGTHVIKLGAYASASKQTAEQSRTVRVEPTPSGAVMAVLKVTHQIEHVTTKPHPHYLPVAFPATEPGNTCKFQKEIPAPEGFEITTARLDPDPGQGVKVRAPKLEITPDRKKVRLSGELLKNPRDPSPWVAPVVLTLERRVARGSKAMSPVAVPLQVPGTTLLPMPMPQGRWTSRQHNLTLEVREGNQPQPLWQTAQLPRREEFNLRGRRYQLTATAVGNQVRIDVVELRPGMGGPITN
jgi:hypothetical protein